MPMPEMNLMLWHIGRSNADMVKIYSRENATQRGQQSGALLGSIAAAVKLLARQLIIEGGMMRKFAQHGEGKSNDIKLGNVQTENGIGWSAIAAAVRLLARQMITEEGVLAKFGQRSEGSKLGHLQSENGEP